MYDNFRLAFSIVWFVSTGSAFALALLLIFTWNADYLPYFVTAIITWGAAAIGTVVTSR